MTDFKYISNSDEASNGLSKTHNQKNFTSNGYSWLKNKGNFQFLS